MNNLLKIHVDTSNLQYLPPAAVLNATSKNNMMFLPQGTDR